MSIQTEKIKELVAKREQARLGGGQKAIDKQHAILSRNTTCSSFTVVTTSAWRRSSSSVMVS